MVKLGLLIGWRVGMLVLALLVHVKCSCRWGSNGCGELVRHYDGGVLCKVYCDGDSSLSLRE